MVKLAYSGTEIGMLINGIELKTQKKTHTPIDNLNFDKEAKMTKWKKRSRGSGPEIFRREERGRQSEMGLQVSHPEGEVGSTEAAV